MYLLDRHDGGKLRLTNFDRGNIPRYAILSHTWGLEEVSFKDVRKSRYHGKTGYRKIEFCLDQALADGLRYCWIDTCCIDRTNSTELTEAVNSMFRWYATAERCYVYLSDISDESFESSRWFTRGWTVLELLAPATVEFFAQEGRKLGDKKSLIQGIHERTQIPVAALQGAPLADFGVQERMAWIEQRSTKLEEDMAYSLLGIFGIFMPLIYGEGRESSQRRLRQHITQSLAFTSQILDQRGGSMVPQGDRTHGGSSVGCAHTASSSVVSGESKTIQPEKMNIQATAGRDTTPEEDFVAALEGVHNLGILYANQRKFTEAEQMFDRALAGRVKMLGHNHANTLDTVDWLGITYAGQGRLAEAETMYRRVLTGREKILGCDDPSTLDVVHRLGVLYADQKRLAEAHAMLNRALAGRERALGPNHSPQPLATHPLSLPQTESSVQNLADTHTTRLDMSKPSTQSPTGRGRTSTSQRTRFVAGFKRLVAKK